MRPGASGGKEDGGCNGGDRALQGGPGWEGIW